MSLLFPSGGQSIGSFSISPSSEYSGLISFRVGWFDLAVHGTQKGLLQHHDVSALGHLLVYLFLAVLGLRCCGRLFSACGPVGAALPCSARASQRGGFSCCGTKASVDRLQQWQHADTAAAVHGLRGPMARGLSPEQGLDPCPLHWQADSHPL